MHSGKIIYPDLNHSEAVVKANAGTNTIIIMMTKEHKLCNLLPPRCNTSEDNLRQKNVAKNEH